MWLQQGSVLTPSGQDPPLTHKGCVVRSRNASEMTDAPRMVCLTGFPGPCPSQSSWPQPRGLQLYQNACAGGFFPAHGPERWGQAARSPAV